MSEKVKAIEAKLNLKKHSAFLKSHDNIWAPLMKLRARAMKDAKVLPQYEAQLKKFVKVAENNAGFTSEDDELAAATALGEHIASTLQSVQPLATGRLPTDVADWCAKYLPLEYEVFQSAFDKAFASPSPASVKAATQAFDDMAMRYKNFYE